MASCMDFRIKVIDDREEFANRERFALADEVICDSFENLKKYLEKDALNASIFYTFYSFTFLSINL